MLVVAVTMMSVLLLFSFGSPIIAKIPSVQDAVINQLKKDKGFCPSPYGPGFSPDRVEMTEFEGWKDD